MTKRYKHKNGSVATTANTRDDYYTITSQYGEAANLYKDFIEDSCDWELFEEKKEPILYAILDDGFQVTSEVSDNTPIYGYEIRTKHPFTFNAEYSKPMINRNIDDYRYFCSPENRQKYIDSLKPKVILTTEDGVDITEKDESVYGLLPKGTWDTNKMAVRCNWTKDIAARKSSWIVFSTKEARDEYILNNKPIFSYNDIQGWAQGHAYLVYSSFWDKLKELGKSKLHL